MIEQRRFHRVCFECLVEFESGEHGHTCELLDISLQGALVGACSGATPEVGTACKLTISLDESKVAQIIMVGSVAHKIENRAGIHCESIDLDSIGHLRKLVEYNLGDSELADREFAELCHNR